MLYIYISPISRLDLHDDDSTRSIYSIVFGYTSVDDEIATDDDNTSSIRSSKYSTWISESGTTIYDCIVIEFYYGTWCCYGIYLTRWDGSCHESYIFSYSVEEARDRCRVESRTDIIKHIECLISTDISYDLYLVLEVDDRVAEVEPSECIAPCCSSECPFAICAETSPDIGES